MLEKIQGNFHKIIEAFQQTEDWKKLKDFIDKNNILPTKDKIFYAFELCPIEKINVVIIGQDPYHTPGAAHGLAFSVPQEYSQVPPSLLNIKKEIANDIYDTKDVDIMNNDLSYLAAQGVLLLNTSLTTIPGVAGAHKKEWENFTAHVMKHLGQLENVVFMLWGKHAQELEGFINHQTNLVLRAAHPSPFSANKGFLGCKHFSKANDYLKTKNKSEIVW